MRCACCGWKAISLWLIFRARQLGLFTEEQARAGYVGLNRHGEALRETEDHLIPSEDPEVIVESLKVIAASVVAGSTGRFR